MPPSTRLADLRFDPEPECATCDDLGLIAQGEGSTLVACPACRFGRFMAEPPADHEIVVTETWGLGKVCLACGRPVKVTVEHA